MKNCAKQEVVARFAESANRIAFTLLLVVCFAVGVVGVRAQTVSGSGTSGQVPVFTGTSTVGNSVITQSGGNVGIGTTAPAYTLDVAGTIRTSSGGIVFPDGSTQTTAFLGGSTQTITAGNVSAGTFGSNTGGGNYTFPAALTVDGAIESAFSGTNTGASWELVTPVSGGNVVDSLVSYGSTSPVGTWPAYSSVEESYDSASGFGVTSDRIWDIYASGNPSYIWQFSRANYMTLNASTGLTVNGNADISGNVGIGTTSPQANLDVNGTVRISGSGAGLTFPDGSVQSTAYTGTCPSTGGDYAESVDVEGDKKLYEPGDVMVLASDGAFDVAKSSEPYSTLVAGIYSTKPGYVGRRQTADPKLSSKEIPMAMVGIVPTKVSAENGPIRRGDLLVTASRAGYAMKGTDHSRMMGAVVGKAMGSLDSGTGVIEVLVSLQ